MYSILSDIRYSFSYFNIRKFKSIYFYLSIHIFFRRGHPGSAGFHCILEPLSLHMCHGSLTALQPLTSSVCFSAMAEQNQKPKTKKQKNKKPKKKHMTRPNSLPLLPPLGCAILLFFCLFFMLFWFLGFWVSCFLAHVFLFEGLRTRIQLFASSPTLGVADLLLVDFIICLWACGNPQRISHTDWKFNIQTSAGHLRNLGIYNRNRRKSSQQNQALTSAGRHISDAFTSNPIVL